VASEGKASYGQSRRAQPLDKPKPTQFVQGFRQLLSTAMVARDKQSGKELGKCIGVYAFYDYDGEPIYVGQTAEKFSTRVGRHLQGQRSDTIAYRILDPFEVAEIELWPAEELRSEPDKKERLNALEYSVYLSAIEASRYRAILNEKMPPPGMTVRLPESYRFNLIPPDLREEREHPDVRIARRAETLARVAAVAHERGVVSSGLRRVIVIQAVRLADLAAARLAQAEGRPVPSASAIDIKELVGDVLGFPEEILDGFEEE